MRRPACQWDRPEHRRHCRHDDWPETFWTGLIDRLARGQAHAGEVRPASHILEMLILLSAGGQFAGVQADSRFSSLSGSVPLRAGQPVRGNHMARPRGVSPWRDQWFESISLQRRVRVSRDFALPRREAGFSRGRAGPAGAARPAETGIARCMAPTGGNISVRPISSTAASMRRWLNKFRSRSGKAEHGPLLVPGKR
jgi:hypothetical protein